MERGTIMPSVVRLVQLSEVLDCETADFLTYSSSTLPDYSKCLHNLLAQLPEHEREAFLLIVDTMIAWHIQSKQTTPNTASSL